MTITILVTDSTHYERVVFATTMEAPLESICHQGKTQPSLLPVLATCWQAALKQDD